MTPWNAGDILPMREHVYLHLKSLILEGVYREGDRLVERDLAAQLNISRTPIREALFRLESQGLVKTIPRKGVVVSSISKENMIEIFGILSSLEGLASEWAAEKMDKQWGMACDQWMSKIKSFLKDHENGDVEKLHLEVCDFLYKAAKNPKLYQMLTDLTDYIRAFANVGYKNSGRMEKAMEEHLQILEAIKNGDAKHAKALAIRHIENSKAAYLDAVALNRKTSKP